MKITIIGAGISGLLSAYYLVKRGYEVEIFEESNRAGGLIKTMGSPYGPMDYAASSLVNSADFEALFDDIKLEMAQIGKLAKVKNIYRGSMKRWPLNIVETIRFVAGVIKLKRSKDKGLNKGRTIDDWGKQYLGKSGHRYLLETFLQGVYAGDGKKMSASLILSPIFNRKKAKKIKPKVKGSIMPSFGMEQLTERLAKYLQKNDVKIHYSSKVNANDIDLSRPTIIATSAPAAGTLLKGMGIEAGEKLVKHDMLDLASVHLVFNEDKPLFKGFGCLFPVSEGFNCLGILAGKNGFPKEYSQPVERWIIGGAHNRNILLQNDEDIIDLALSDRKRIAGIEEKPIASIVLRRSQSLPHYTPELEEIIDNIKLPPNLHLIGNYLGGIGLSAILKESQKLAVNIEDKKRRSIE